MSFLLQKLLTFYQRGISPFLPKRCRFYPTCSQYAHQCLETKPLLPALYWTLRRLLRCHPWHPGGYDPVV